MQTGESKQRGDAEIDKIFKSDKDRDEFFIASEGRNLWETQKVLERDFKCNLSLNTISRWLHKVRTERADQQFYLLIGEIKDDAARAETLAKEIGTERNLTSANVTMIEQMLFRARRSGDGKQMMAAAKMLSLVIGAVSDEKAASARVITAETQRERFHFDAAKVALAAASDLQQIQQSKGSEREKIEKAVERLFGKKPKGSGGA
jgi:hypothetical protein